MAAFVDAEHALDPLYASRIGVKIDDLLISQPDTGEQALEIVEVLVRSGAVDVIVIDSVAALVPKAEIEGEMGDSHMGLQARLMSQALRKLTAAISKSNCSVIFLNQLREKVGIMFGNPETQPGGRALKFYSSVRLDIRKVEVIKSGLDSVGARVKVKVVKNKVAPPFRSAEFDILFNEGISREGSLIDAALEYGILEKSGTWMSYGDQRLGQGRENVRNYLRENPTLSAEIEARVREKAAGGTASAVMKAAGVVRAPTECGGGVLAGRGPRGKIGHNLWSALWMLGLRLLGRRAHSRAEMRRKLGRRGYSPDETEAAMARLDELGYLDDRSFAEGLVRRRGAIRGPMALSAELAARGVDRDQADAALAGFDRDAQLASATRLAERLYAKQPAFGSIGRC